MKKQIQQRPTMNELPLPSSMDSVLQRIFHRRKLSSLNELENGLAQLLPYATLSGLEQAVSLLSDALHEQQDIVVVGDFDADGATSTAIAVKALRLFGSQRIRFHVPNRFKYGYGLTPGIVDEICLTPTDLIITVDNGIASIDGVNCAKKHGVKVLVTDHHLAADVLPDADAIINPNQPGDAFPSKNLAGVGVIFYVMLALRSHLRSIDWFNQQGLAEPNMGQLLDIVALGTVADVVPLDHNNRILVSQGLKRIRAGHACPGIQALLEVSKRSAQRIVAADFGFALGPRLNAAGRLEDMSIGINCLLASNIDEARIYAGQLDSLNQERKAIEQEMKTQALDNLQHLDLDNSDDFPMGVCIYEQDWHQGVIGILASRIKDHLNRPVIALADEDDNNLKGSACSIPGVHIRDVLDVIDKRHPGVITKFGGHAMAAGLSLPKASFDTFKQAFAAEVAKHVSKDELQGTVFTDGQLEAAEFTLDTAENLRQSGPWGQEFPEPIFDGVFDVLSTRILAEKHLKLQLSSAESKNVVEAIAFNVLQPGEQSPVNVGDKTHIAYRLDVNEFRGNRSLQLMLECFGEA
jgi:single-stranded-DNA-specific exonuclease